MIKNTIIIKDNNFILKQKFLKKFVKIELDPLSKYDIRIPICNINIIIIFLSKYNENNCNFNNIDNLFVYIFNDINNDSYLMELQFLLFTLKINYLIGNDDEAFCSFVCRLFNHNPAIIKKELKVN